VQPTTGRSGHPELESESELAFAAHMQTRESAFSVIFGESYPSDRIITPSNPRLSLDGVNWPVGGVFQYAPAGGRIGWHYVTHGLAQPSEPTLVTESDPEAVSGLGK
jgi:hypothetical protein